MFDAQINTEALDEQVVKSMLSVRPPDFHKGDAGRVHIVGGSPGMTGAPCLAGSAALRMGAGLITVVTPESLRPIVEAKQMEVMTVGIPDGGTGYFAPGMIPALVLMENAGRSCTDRIFRILEEKAGGPQEASVAVVCGKGNNGGDGMVIARHLHNRGA